MLNAFFLYQVSADEGKIEQIVSVITYNYKMESVQLSNSGWHFASTSMFLK